VGKVPIHLNTNVNRAWVENGCVNLELSDGKSGQTLKFDHVVAATGYQVDVERLSILSPEIRGNIRLTEKAPLLSAYFESSVNGLYFVGVAAANTFGPVMRFVFGARYTATRITKHLVTVLARSVVLERKATDMRVTDQTTA
jgi:thioredoxin reductase